MQYCNKHLSSQQGLALICVLIFLQVFAVFTLCAIRSHIIALQILQQNTEKYRFNNAAEHALTLAETNLKQSLNLCQIPNTPRDYLIKQTREWWQSNACSGSFEEYRYYFVIESLGLDDCARVKTASNVLDGSGDYYRLTLLLMQPAIFFKKEFLQSTILVSHAPVTNCTSSTRTVISGRQFMIRLF